MGPYSDYTLMERNRLLQEHVHTLEGMLRASCSEVGRGGEWAGAARDFSEACEQAGDLLERNRLLQGRVHTLEGLLRAYRIIQAYRSEVVSGEEQSAIERKRYEAYEHACTQVGISPEETSDREARDGRQQSYTERYKGYTFTCATVTDPLSPDACCADDTVFLSAAHEAFTVSPTKRGNRRRYHRFPLYACIYGGDITLSLDKTRDPFNHPRYGCQVGWVFVKKGIGEDARAVAEDRVQAWHAFWRGDVWSFHVEDAEGQRVEGDDGLYGDLSWVAQEARAVIDELTARTAGQGEGTAADRSR